MNIFINSFFFIYSIFPIALYGVTIVLNIVLIVMSLINLCISLTLFAYLRKIVKCEREKMLPHKVLILHGKEYTDDYNSKLKEVIGDQEVDKQHHLEEYNQDAIQGIN